MINLKYLINRIKDVKPKDMLAVFPMVTARVASLFYKNRYKNTWLICEEKAEARDNGYWFFRKMCENHPEQECIYAIDKTSVDYKKVKDLGTVIKYGGFMHWILYFTCAFNISSQKGGKPNAPLCAFIELNDWYNAHNVFLEHGVTINKVVWLFADRSRFDMMVASTRPEFEFKETYFGYPKGVMQLTGLPRWDNLHSIYVKRNRIVVMPTWRYWFNLKSKEQGDLTSDFVHSEYLQKWKEFLECDELNRLIRENELEVIFYPHRNMQNHLPDFRRTVKTNAILASWTEYDIQELMMSSEMMITDYSSVFFDMVYMKKPIIFYQFDLEDFRKGQYEEGYFNYQNNPFGKSCFELQDLMAEFKRIVAQDYKCEDEFLKAHEEYFPYYDTNNSERVYEAVKTIWQNR